MLRVVQILRPSSLWRRVIRRWLSPERSHLSAKRSVNQPRTCSGVEQDAGSLPPSTVGIRSWPTSRVVLPCCGLTRWDWDETTECFSVLLRTVWESRRTQPHSYRSTPQEKVS